VLTQLRLASGPVREVLAEAGLLDDDRVLAIHAWFIRATAGLPEPMASELRTWFEVMTNGSTTPPRSRPRQPRTVEQKLRWALPALRAWAGAGHTSLREITREQVLAALPGSGTARATTGQGLRSVFTHRPQSPQGHLHQPGRPHLHRPRRGPAAAAPQSRPAAAGPAQQ
jgi:hypothetical protein